MFWEYDSWPNLKDLITARLKLRPKVIFGYGKESWDPTSQIKVEMDMHWSLRSDVKGSRVYRAIPFVRSSKLDTSELVQNVSVVVDLARVVVGPRSRVVIRAFDEQATTTLAAAKGPIFFAPLFVILRGKKWEHAANSDGIILVERAINGHVATGGSACRFVTMYLTYEL